MTPLLVALALAAAPASPAPAGAAPERTLPGGRFGAVALLQPARSPARAVLYLSGAAGWTSAERGRARALAADGALVLGLSTPRWARGARGGSCAYPAGDLESLAQAVQKQLGLPAYLRPILVGEGPGSAVASAAAAQAPAGTFLGAIAVGKVPAPDPALRFCRGGGASRGAPPPVAVPEGDPGALRAAVAALDAASRPAASPAPSSGPAVADLPLVEVPASAQPGRAFALLVTGDGGWAGIDREIAAALAGRGLTVVGLDSLKYFWTRRTPEGFAADLGRIIEHYAAALGRGEVALVGYSRGADVLPAAVGLLAPTPRARVKALTLLGPGRAAEFELHLTDFLGGGDGGRPILPDVERLAGTPLVCLYGREEADESLCPLLRARGGATVVELPGAHHFGGDYAAVAREVVKALGEE